MDAVAGNEGGATGFRQPHAQGLALASVRFPHQEGLRVDRGWGLRTSLSRPSRPTLSHQAPGDGEALTPGGSVLSTCSAAAALARSCSHTGRVSSRRSRRLTVRPGCWGPPACAPPASGTSYSGAWAGLGADTRPEQGARGWVRPLVNPLPLLCPDLLCSPSQPSWAALPTLLTFLSPGAQAQSWSGWGFPEGLLLAPPWFPWRGAPSVGFSRDSGRESSPQGRSSHIPSGE